jgi:hypothetical protein
VGDLTVEGIVTVGPTARLNVRNTLSAAAIDSSGTVTLGANSTVTGAVTVTGGSFSIESASAELFVLDKLRLGRNATFSAVEGSTVRMTGAHFENESTDPAALSGLGNISFIFEGGSTQNDTFEIAGEDMGGDDMAGLVDNFTIDTLQLGGSDIGVLQLVDLFDNQADGQAFGEALYVKNLIVGPGSSLDLNGLNLYYLDADLDPTGEIIGGMPTKVVPEPATLSLLGLGGLAVIRRRRRK